jgi:tRNA (guanine37-N1)-methyltransferase
VRIDVLTLFPELFEAFLRTSIVGQAVTGGVVAVGVHDLRDWATGRHRSVDDSPYGGGPGMVMRPGPLVAAIEALAGPKGPGRSVRVVLLSPQGERLSQRRLENLAAGGPLLLVCGRYEGVDQRAIDLAVDEELSLGDYVLSGGEVPAMAVIEGVVRLLPGALGNPASARSESFQTGLLEGPQYTRPPEFRGLGVPAVLRSGDHAAIQRWREERAAEITGARRPDLMDSGAARATQVGPEDRTSDATSASRGSNRQGSNTRASETRGANRKDSR